MTKARVAGATPPSYIAAHPLLDCTDTRSDAMDWFYLYFVGFLVLIVAVGLGLDKLGLGAQWIFIVCLGLFGVAVMSAVKRSRGAGGGPPA